MNRGTAPGKARLSGLVTANNARGRWYSGFAGGAFPSSNTTATVNRLTAHRFEVGERPVSYNSIGVVTTSTAASSTLRLAVYADDGYCRPGALIIDAGTLNTATLSAFISLPMFATLVGRVWLAGVFQGGTPTVNASTTASHDPLIPLQAPYSLGQAAGYEVTGTSGNLPMVWPTAYAEAVVGIIRLYLKAA